MNKKTPQPKQKASTKKGLIYTILDEHLIFFVEAMAVNKTIHQDIEELYKTKSRLFKEYAAKSELSRHPLIINGSIQHEEISLKILGILHHTRENSINKQVEAIHEIIYKGWPRACRNVLNFRNTDIEAYIRELKNESKRNYAANSSELFIFFLLCSNSKMPIVSPAWMLSYFTALSLRAYVYSGESHFDSFKEKDKSTQAEILKLKESVFKEYGISISSDNQITIRNNELLSHFKFLYRLAFVENVEVYSMFRDIEFSENDIYDILCSSPGDVLSLSSEEAAKRVIMGYVVKLMAKSISSAKMHHFQQSAELAEIRNEAKALDSLTLENKKLKSENRLHLNSISDLKEKLRLASIEAEKPHLERIRELEKLIAKQREALLLQQEKDRELAALREFFFSLENRDSNLASTNDTETVMDLKDTVAAIIGGNPKWSAKMKELLPNWVFITSKGFDKRSLDNVQTVFFVPNSMSHSLYYKAVAIARNKNMDIGFIYSQNEQLALKEIAKTLARAGS